MKIGDLAIFIARYKGEVQGEFYVQIIGVRQDTLGRTRYDVAYMYGLGGERGLFAGALKPIAKIDYV